MGQLAHGANGFRVAGMADHDHLQAGIRMTLRFDMDLADQRAGGIDIDHVAGLCRGRHGFRHAMGRENHRAIIWAVTEFLNKHRTFVAQTINHEFIVNDLMAHIDRCPPFFQSHLNNLDGPVHARAEPARRSKVQFQR